MRMLAIEAGGPVLSAALFEDGRAAGEAWLRAPQRQTEQLAPLVAGLLERHGWPARGLDAVACGQGPGSFTGLRSSMAFATGLALGSSGLKLWAVPTLKAWAEAFAPSGARKALVLLDGRRGQAYRGPLRRGSAGGWEFSSAPGLVDLSAILQDLEPGTVVLGDAAAGPEPRLSAQDALDSAALALAVGRLASAELLAGSPQPAFEPEYLRRSEAELLWERLHPAAPAGTGGA